MTHTTAKNIQFLSLSALIVLAAPLRADDGIQVRWIEVCRVAEGKQLTIKTLNGDTVAGYCMSINVNEIAVNTKDKKVVKIARTTLSRIDMERKKNQGHQLRSLGNGVRTGLRKGFEWLLSPSAPLAIVAVPVTLAWGAVAAPFCLIGDLTYKAGDMQQIKVI